MKKIFLLGMVSGYLLAVSCSSKNPATNTGEMQIVRSDVMKLKGQWNLSNVDYDKNYSIKPFDEGVSINCFVGSSWTLIPNNYTGSYELHGSSSSCLEKTQKITFSVDKNSVVSIKKLDEGEKAKKVSFGYQLILENPTENSFTLLQSVNADGKTLNIRYNFIRTSK